MTPLNQRLKETRAIIKGIEDSATQIGAASIKIKDKAIDKAISVNRVKKSYVAASLVEKEVDSALQSVIKDTKKDFKDFLRASEKYLIDGYAIKLTKADLENIARKGSVIIDDLVRNTEILNSDLQEILTQNLGKGVSEKKLVKSLQKLYPAYARNASTVINTGLGRLFTDMNVTKFQETGQKYYLYAGPDDKITRETPCKHWVRHWFPVSQLAEVTAIKNGLYNCRHSIIAISEEETKDYSKLELSAGQ